MLWLTLYSSRDEYQDRKDLSSPQPFRHMNSSSDGHIKENAYNWLVYPNNSHISRSASEKMELACCLGSSQGFQRECSFLGNLSPCSKESSKLLGEGRDFWLTHQPPLPTQKLFFSPANSHVEVRFSRWEKKLSFSLHKRESTRWAFTWCSGNSEDMCDLGRPYTLFQLEPVLLR